MLHIEQNTQLFVQSLAQIWLQKDRQLISRYVFDALQKYL